MTTFRTGRAYLIRHDGSKRLIALLRGQESLTRFLARYERSSFLRKLYKQVEIQWVGADGVNTQRVGLKQWNRGVRWPMVSRSL